MGRSMATGVSGTVMMSGGSWLTSMLLGQVTATVGLGFYAVLVGPLVAHDGIGAFLAGVLLAVSIEGYRRPPREPGGAAGADPRCHATACVRPAAIDGETGLRRGL